MENKTRNANQPVPPSMVIRKKSIKKALPGPGSYIVSEETHAQTVRREDVGVIFFDRGAYAGYRYRRGKRLSMLLYKE